ncbi:MAG TPA: MurT ligase domain-containing protein [Candidatus Nanoperiomorbaceae bacterium]|nr:MurT ligase domain-containing protein [Candidatus Nanoperiomorbaceae bacterium]HMQ96777.1 MurT ligase domain-containing protein [Candidatus Nanoperiomorbaceae bacterium]HMR86488.1 MurT ligase domain-containing protein [Candidatus Nanoperiomorbaceae bacterium]
MKSLFLSSSLGKIVSKASRLRGGHGSALPGLVVEKVSPHFLRDALTNLPYGVVVISGTNGKTTTTKIVVELLRAAGLKVFTNPSGSNFTRGIASVAALEMRRGRLDADIAVVELDEAHAVHFVRQVPPKYSLILNVLRDQLDRFGEIDTTAKLLAKVADQTTGTVVLNREDPLVAAITANRKVYFGYSGSVATLFPNDDELYSTKKRSSASQPDATVTLDELDGSTATFNIGSSELLLRGAHNALNAAAALALVREILGDTFEADESLAALSQVQPAFGRGESFTINGQPLELILVKNPSGFRISLASQNDPNAATMIAINDQYADGRDMSWLWDVDFSKLSSVAMISGVRAYDMALRLETSGINVGAVETDLTVAVDQFLTDRPMQIYATYTAMLKIRKALKARRQA